jgi:hypothetical protein
LTIQTDRDYRILRTFVDRLPFRERVFIAPEVRDFSDRISLVPREETERSWGHAFKRAAREGTIVCVGYTTYCGDDTMHQQPVRMWRAA